MAKRVIPLVINGQRIVSADKALHVPVYSLATRELLHYAQGATVSQALLAAETSAQAFKSWRNVAPQDRREILLAGVNNLRRRRQEGIDIQRAESTPSEMFASLIYDFAIAHATEWASVATTMTGTIAHSAQPGLLPLIFNEPCGPVLGIAPWNAPSILGMRAFGTPIAAGCSAILKTSHLSPASHMFMAEAFLDAGLPDGVLNVVHSRPEDSREIVAALIASEHVRKINFTGSTATGRAIAVTAAEHLKPVLLELGGKAASVVLADADLAAAAETVVIGGWENNGQICMSTERVYVDRAVLPAFETLLKEKAAFFDPILVQGGQITAEHTAKVRQLVDDAVAKGARFVHGSASAAAARVTPSILTDVTEDMALYHEESFGPTFVVVPYDTVDEAVAMVNRSKLGLTASVWTQNALAGIAVARQLESGAVHINGMTVHDESTQPHGGVKESGYGRFGGKWGLQEFSYPKTVTVR
ncbi:Aldehyde/histidinol dehydrogenase [Dipodascopsis tothii]|uniref:Aldehyde/histidinol dehydrogenase n=1 Tax=Dipodascopsis tothii TaxID=44089 RepID=UPI0034CEE144